MALMVMVLMCRVLIILMATINSPIILISIIDNLITIIIQVIDITDGITGTTKVNGVDMAINIMAVDGGIITDDEIHLVVFLFS